LEDIQLEDGSTNGGAQSSQAMAMLDILRKIESDQPFSDEDENSTDAGSVDLTEEQLSKQEELYHPNIQPPILIILPPFLVSLSLFLASR
jgi:hypothetical protein